MHSSDLGTAIVTGLLAIFSTVFGALLRSFGNKVTSMERSISEGQQALTSHRLHAAESFARKEEIRDMRREINDKLDDILQELKTKADK